MENDKVDGRPHGEPSGVVRPSGSDSGLTRRHRVANGLEAASAGDVIVGTCRVTWVPPTCSGTTDAHGDGPPVACGAFGVAGDAGAEPGVEPVDHVGPLLLGSFG